MVALIGPSAMIDGKFRQARKGATVAVDSCAGVWLVWAATNFLVEFSVDLPPDCIVNCLSVYNGPLIIN